MNIKRFFGSLYGAVIVLSYLSIKALSGQNYLLYFTISCAVLALFTLPFLKLPFPKVSSGILVRGVLYAVTNFLMLASQNQGKVSSSLAAALIGTLVVSLPSLLKPPYRAKNLLILSCIAVGVSLLMDQIVLSYLAVISGLIQAITFTTAGKLMRTHEMSIRWNLIAGFTCVSVLGGVVSFFTSLGDLSELKVVNLACIMAVILISQISFFQLYRNFSIETAGRFSLGRIPWSYVMEMIYSASLAPVHTIIGVLVLSVGSFLRKERRGSAR